MAPQDDVNMGAKLNDEELQSILASARAGAVVTDLSGGPVVPGSVFAATPRIAAPLRAVLASLGANDVP